MGLVIWMVPHHLMTGFTQSCDSGLDVSYQEVIGIVGCDHEDAHPRGGQGIRHRHEYSGLVEPGTARYVHTAPGNIVCQRVWDGIGRADHRQFGSTAGHGNKVTDGAEGPGRDLLARAEAADGILSRQDVQNSAFPWQGNIGPSSRLPWSRWPFDTLVISADPL
jgi:hypothetical protein